MQVSEYANFSSLNKKRYDFTKFTSLQGDRGRSQRARKQPMVTINKQQVYFNTNFHDKYKHFKKITVGFYQDQLLLTFYRAEGAPVEAMKLSAHNNSFSLSFSSMAKTLQKKTKAIDLEHFTYKYKVTMEDDGIHSVITLKEPFNKSRTNGGSHK